MVRKCEGIISSELQSGVAEASFFRDLRIGMAFVLIPSSIPSPTHHGVVAVCHTPDGSPAATHPAESFRIASGRPLEEVLHLHGEAHVAGDLELPAHEGHLTIELAHDHVDVVG